MCCIPSAEIGGREGNESSEHKKGVTEVQCSEKCRSEVKRDVEAAHFAVQCSQEWSGGRSRVFTRGDRIAKLATRLTVTATVEVKSRSSEVR
mmetsp:Transcript_413/g.942  ORF Transcript_413/g.942 Transcript_413/m.942 type:complete len:92 (+) Transcript_413:1178-1453(+)